MDGIRQAIAADLEKLRNSTESDFAAIASPVPDEAVWRWTYASGNLMGRFAKLAIKPGRGIAGAVLRTGTAVILDRHLHAADLRKEDMPFLTSEQLTSAAAVPIMIPESPIGVLLIGSRSPREYDSESLNLLVQAASRLSPTLLEERRHSSSAL